MITDTDLYDSVSRHLYQNIEVAEGIKVFEYSNIDMIQAELDAGDAVVYWFIGKDFKEDKNHPRKKIHLGVLKKVSISASRDCNVIADKLQSNFKKMLSFPIYNTSGDYQTEAVIIDSVRAEYFIDKDRFINLPIILEIGYANVA